MYTLVASEANVAAVSRLVFISVISDMWHTVTLLKNLTTKP